MKIVVLAGGLSTERDVSFATGKMVSTALRSKGHQVLVLDVFMGYGKDGDDLEGIFDKSEVVSVRAGGIAENAPDIQKVKAMREGDPDCFFGPNVIALCHMADIVFLALHGENGENGKLQAAFDLFGIRYTGSDYLGSALAMNKELSKRFFQASGIPVSKGIVIKKDGQIPCFEDTGLTLPCIVKPCCGGSSVGVSVINTKEEYHTALDAAFYYEDEVLLEEYIKGREFSIAVIDGQALPVIEIAPIAGFYDYKNKYIAGNTIETCPADLAPEIAGQMQEYAVAATRALGLDTYSRVDFMLDNAGHMYCLEVNTLPGMTPTSLLPQEAKAIHIEFADLCEWLIEISIRKYNRKRV